MINLYSHQVGLPQAPRWIIKSDGLFWDGSSWTMYGENSLLFNDKNEAEGVISELMQALFNAIPVWKFRFEVIIEVRNIVKPTLQSIQELVIKNISIDLDVEGLSTHIDWDKMKEIK